MNCPKCGELQRDEAIFCPTCGNRLRPQSPVPPPVPPPLPQRQGRSVRNALFGLLAVALLCAVGFIVWKHAGTSEVAVSAPPPPGEARPTAPATSTREEPPLMSSAGLDIFFPDLRWGDPPTRDMVLDEAADEPESIKAYLRSGGVRSFDGVPFERVRCRFHRQRFITAECYVSAENAKPLRTAAEKRFGAPQRNEDGSLKWTHKDTVVIFVSDPTSDEHGFAISGTGLGAFAMQEAVGQTEGKQQAGPAPHPRIDTSEDSATPTQNGEVYAAEFSCVGPGGRSASLVQCFSQSSIKVRRGNRSRVYSAQDLYSDEGPVSSVKMTLPATFEIEAMNSAPLDVIVLSLTITEISTGKVVYEDQAARWGWIKVKN